MSSQRTLGEADPEGLAGRPQRVGQYALRRRHRPPVPPPPAAASRPTGPAAGSTRPPSDLELEIAYLLELPSCEACTCISFRKALKLGLFQQTGRFITYGYPRSTSSGVRHEEIVEMVSRAIRRCPFCGKFIDPELSHPFLRGQNERDALCCVWMHRAVQDGLVRFPASDEQDIALPRLVASSSKLIPFPLCPRCLAETTALVHRRRAFFSSSA